MKRFVWILVFALLLAGCQQSTPTEAPSKETVTDAPTTETPETKTPTEPQTEAPTEVPTEAPTEPAEPYEPKAPDSAKINLDFEKVVAAGQALDEKELEKVTSFLTAGKDDGEAVPWGFVRQTYNDPSEIDIALVYYNKGTEKDVPKEEADAAYKAMGWEPMGLEAQKRTMDAVKEAFNKYTGKDLTEDQLKAFSVWIYVPEYDAYYSFVTDMPDDIHADQFGRACTLDKAAAEALGLPVKADEMIAVEWTEVANPGQESPLVTGMVLLVPDGDGYRFAANLLYE